MIGNKVKPVVFLANNLTAQGWEFQFLDYAGHRSIYGQLAYPLEISEGEFVARLAWGMRILKADQAERMVRRVFRVNAEDFWAVEMERGMQFSLSHGGRPYKIIRLTPPGTITEAEWKVYRNIGLAANRAVA